MRNNKKIIIFKIIVSNTKAMYITNDYIYILLIIKRLPIPYCREFVIKTVHINFIKLNSVYQLYLENVW